jgi:hypothetical protein
LEIRYPQAIPEPHRKIGRMEDSINTSCLLQ